MRAFGFLLSMCGMFAGRYSDVDEIIERVKALRRPRFRPPVRGQGPLRDRQRSRLPSGAPQGRRATTGRSGTIRPPRRTLPRQQPELGQRPTHRRRRQPSSRAVTHLVQAADTLWEPGHPRRCGTRLPGSARDRSDPTTSHCSPAPHRGRRDTPRSRPARLSHRPHPSRRRGGRGLRRDTRNIGQVRAGLDRVSRSHAPARRPGHSGSGRATGAVPEATGAEPQAATNRIRPVPPGLRGTRRPGGTDRAAGCSGTEQPADRHGTRPLRAHCRESSSSCDARGGAERSIRGELAEFFDRHDRKG